MSEWRREFPGAIGEVGRALAWVESVAALLGLPEQQTYAVLLCVEELATNIVRHGDRASRRAGAPLTFIISLRATDDRVILTLEDNGARFDIVKAPTKEINQPIECVEPGGLGVLLVKRFASQLAYHETENGNKTVAEFVNP